MPSWTNVCTRADASLVSPIPETKLRSIFKMSIGKRCRNAKDEYQVPKSSTAKCTPRPFSASRRDGGVHVVHERGLADLEDQTLSVKAALGQRVSNLVDDSVPDELLGRHVDRDRKTVTLTVPLRALATRFL